MNNINSFDSNKYKRISPYRWGMFAFDDTSSNVLKISLKNERESNSFNTIPTPVVN